jgi:hypothetical protein
MSMPRRLRALSALLGALVALAVTPLACAQGSPGTVVRNGVPQIAAIKAFEVLPDGFRLATVTIDITVRNGAITRVLNKVTGEVHANGGPASPYMPRGLMCAANGYAGIRLLHGQWATHPTFSGQLASTISGLARAPSTGATVGCIALPNGARCTWTKLTGGPTLYANDQLVVEALVDPATGFIDLSVEGSSQASDVVGALMPVLNLHNRHSIYVPSFGGMVYRPADLAGAQLRVLHSAPFLEAPLLVAEGDAGCISMWMEDQTFKPYVAFIGGDASSSAMGLEAVNKMPFEGKRAVRKSTWRIGAFAGTWPTAMIPYRDWYARTFATEIALRKSVAWPAGVSVIVDSIRDPNANLPKLQQLLNPSTVLLHDWYARQPEFDTALPDWTPRSSFTDLVTLGRSLGFKTMGYVNTFCVNYQSPAFQNLGIANFGLTRKVASLNDYGLPQKTFANSAPNEILYLDPLSPQWRQFHTNQMIQWRSATGADANYADTGGTAGDFGNGEVGGLFGAQGGWAQFRDLLQRNPVPMATEFAPDNMAFASSWALRMSQHWGDTNIRKLWETRHRPINSLIFSGASRAWVPMYTAESEAVKWTVVACSDALGGVAQLEATDASFKSVAGLARHMVDRAQLFSRLGLTPTHDAWPRDSGLVAQYRAKNGAIYRYRVRGGIQEMVAPNGQPVYQRVTNQQSIDSPLRIAGWPAWKGTQTIGLQPSARYALGAAVGGPTVQIDRCPGNAWITRFTETSGFALVNLGSTPAASSPQTALGIVARADFADVIVRSEDGTMVRRNAQLRTGERMDLNMPRPREILLLRQLPAAPPLLQPLGMIAGGGKYVIDGSGLERGGLYTPIHNANWTIAGSTLPTAFRFTSWGGDSEIAYERLLAVPSATTSLSVTYRNTQAAIGNGAVLRVSVNGRVVFSKDLGPTPGASGPNAWDVRAHNTRVPLGAFNGTPIVVTVSVWGKADDNSDEIWVAEPVLMNDPTQQLATASAAIVP